MAYREESVAGLTVGFQNIPGSSNTKVWINDEPAFGYDPKSETFYDCKGGKIETIEPDLPASQLEALRCSLVRHTNARAAAPVSLVGNSVS